jgi:hypothetical protein
MIIEKMDKVYNPDTKRYVKRDSKKGIELLLKLGDKGINKNYEIINGKIFKRCPEGKYRNSNNRCIKRRLRLTPILKEDSRTSSTLSHRLSARINTRIRFYKKMKKYLNIKNRSYKLEIHGFYNSKKASLKVANIILNKRIGSDSAYGNIFLCNIQDKTNEIYQYASKLVVKNSRTEKELEILNKLSQAVIKDKCPHFPMIFAHLQCDIPSSAQKDPSKYPEVVIKNKDKSFLLILTELANGDLKGFMEMNDKSLYLNALTQIYLSIMFFYNETGCFHGDTYWGNFLFHKINDGGYFHYKLFGIDYYLENLGYLWIIWDFDYAISFEKSIDKNLRITGDFDDIIEDFKKTNLNEINEINKLYKNKTYNHKLYSKKLMKRYLRDIVKTLFLNNMLLKSVPSKSLIINKIPYEIK